MATQDDTAARDGKAMQTEASDASQAEAQPEELKNINYELLLIGFSVLSVLNIFLYIVIRDPVVDGVIEIINVPLTVIFFFDFLLRFRSAKSKGDYFFRQFGWADLASSLPFPQFKILRVFRIVRAWRMISHYGAKNLARQISAHRADAALSVIAFLIVLVLEFGGILVLIAERSNPDANITTPSDAVWWAFVTITTVGYGDKYPTTNAGRIVGVLVMTTGVGLFGVLTGYLANAFLTPPKPKEEDTQEAEQTEQTVQTVQPAQTPAQLDSQAMLIEMQQLMSAQEKAQEELRAMLVELKQTARGSVAGGQ